MSVNEMTSSNGEHYSFSFEIKDKDIQEGRPQKTRRLNTNEKICFFILGSLKKDDSQKRKLPENTFPKTPSPKAKNDAVKYTTPTKIHHVEMPSTPLKIKRRALFVNVRENTSLFSGLISDYMDSEYKDALFIHYIDSKAYTTPTGRNLTVIKQIGSKSCGAACALMLALDQKRNYITQKLPVSDLFIEWFYACDLTRAEDLKKKLKQENFTPIILNYIKNEESVNPKSTNTIKTKYFNNGFEILEDIKNIIETTNNSVIIGIDHPKIESHWIIIDCVDTGNNKVYLRDPFSGKAYCSDLPEIARYIYSVEEGCSKIEGFYLENQS